MCNKEGCNNPYIENKKYGLCGDCNFERIHHKTRLQAYKDKNEEKSDKVIVRVKKTVKTPKNKQKYKNTGELLMFKEIWEERDHICINCKKELGEELNIQYFSHRVSKGRDAKLRLEKSNIDILCCECHFAHEFQGNKKFKEREDKYKV